MSKSIATTAEQFLAGTVSEPATEAVDRGGQSSTAFKLLILFLLLMYSSIGAIYPATEAFRPASLAAIGAVIFTVLEVAKRGAGFRIAWPEGVMILVLLGVSAISTFGSIYLSFAAETTTNLAKIV